MNKIFGSIVVVLFCSQSLSGTHDELYKEIRCGELRYTAVQALIDQERVKSCINADGYVWMVSIHNRKESKDANEHGGLCKGFLIHPQLVITTAACVKGYNPDHLMVKTGAWIPDTIRSSVPIQQMTVSNITIHPNFLACDMRNNHALLLLSENFNMNDKNVGVICVSDSEDFNRDECVPISTKARFDCQNTFDEFEMSDIQDLIMYDDKVCGSKKLGSNITSQNGVKRAAIYTERNRGTIQENAYP